MGESLGTLTAKTRAPLNSRFHALKNEGLTGSVDRLQSGDSIQYRSPRDFDTACEHKGCAESFVQRVVFIPFGFHPCKSLSLVDGERPSSFCKPFLEHLLLVSDNTLRARGNMTTRLDASCPD